MRPPRPHRVGLYYFFLLCALDPIRVRHLVCTPSILWTMETLGVILYSVPEFDVWCVTTSRQTVLLLVTTYTGFVFCMVFL